MPVEIRELEIRASVAPEQSANSSGGSEVTSQQFEQMKNEIVAECMAKIKEMIKEQNER